MGENKLSAKLNKHFAALGAAAAAVTGIGITEQADAAIVHSGPVNIAIPGTTQGVYLNVVTGFTQTSGSFAGYDINPYQSSATGPAMSFFTSATANASTANRGYVTGQAGGTNTAASLNLAFGDPIGPTSTYNTGISAGTNYPAAGVNGLLGFRFFNEGAAQLQYGWARIVRPTTSTGIGSITEYAYEDSGAAIGAGVVPEPASLGLLAMGALGMIRRRK